MRKRKALDGTMMMMLAMEMMTCFLDLSNACSVKESCTQPRKFFLIVSVTTPLVFMPSVGFGLWTALAT